MLDALIESYEMRIGSTIAVILRCVNDIGLPQGPTDPQLVGRILERTSATLLFMGKIVEPLWDS